MIEILRESLTNQYAAALGTLNACIVACPEENWHAPVVNLKFCQVAFHTLFYTDYYLGPDADSIRQQQFHLDHADLFRDYEERQDRKQHLLYERDDVTRYFHHCRNKANDVLEIETPEILAGPSGFERRNFTRAELHAYNIRTSNIMRLS